MVGVSPGVEGSGELGVPADGEAPDGGDEGTDVLPPPVEQALTSTRIDAPRASVRDIRIGSSYVVTVPRPRLNGSAEYIGDAPWSRGALAQPAGARNRPLLVSAFGVSLPAP